MCKVGLHVGVIISVGDTLVTPAWVEDPPLVREVVFPTLPDLRGEWLQ
jgi:hypothetical protein